MFQLSSAVFHMTNDEFTQYDFTGIYKFPVQKGFRPKSLLQKMLSRYRGVIAPVSLET